MSKYEKIHIHNQKEYSRVITTKYQKAIAAIAKEISLLPISEERPFSFSDYPYIKKKIDAILQNLQKGIKATIVSGITIEAKLADEYVKDSVNEFISSMDIGNLFSVDQKIELIQKYTSSSVGAALKFAERKVKGMNLSTRVWSFTKMLKADVEVALEEGIKKGTSAAELSRTIRNALREPNKLFRSVRQADGTFKLSKAAEAYHPGRGVYRSSYKNALRMTATETNIAYRSSTASGFQSLDFHRGWSISLSNNHTLRNAKTGKVEPLFDICDELMSIDGDERTYYPYDWVHIGWHPHCRCFAIPVLQDRADFMADLLNDRVNTTKKIEFAPVQLEDWKERMLATYLGYATTPYFIMYNKKYF